MMDFANKLVVITGVGRSGQAERGATLALMDLQSAEVEARAAALVSAGYTATPHVANLADAEAARVAASQIAEVHSAQFDGAVHAVICVAGGFGTTGPIDESDPAAWHKQFVINLDTAYATTRAFLPALRKTRGSLVYFVSAASLPGGKSAGMAAYNAAKSGVIALLRTVAEDEDKNGVRANAVAPVAIRTAANLADMSDKTKYVERESVAEVVAFLASHAARNVTGQVLRLA
jgi:meso-butanediol dehydrogenase / (S,S)-butanediol dehydrogenase / diacetyl reductase